MAETPHVLSDEQIDGIADATLLTPAEMSWTTRQHYFARAILAAAEPVIRAQERERIITQCVPGGSVCDPQQVVDAIRELGVSDATA